MDDKRQNLINFEQNSTSLRDIEVMEDHVYETPVCMTKKDIMPIKEVKPAGCSTVRVLILLNTLSIVLILAHFVLFAVIHYGPDAEMHTSRSTDIIIPSELTNLALLPGVNCSASSVYSSDYSCDKAIGNKSGTNWVGNQHVNPVSLTINFPRSVVITSVKLWPRCALYTQTTRVDYSMSLSSYKIQRECGGTGSVHNCRNVNHDPEVFFKDDVHTRTTYLEVKIHGDFCDRTNYSYLGVREIEIWGYY